MAGLAYSTHKTLNTDKKKGGFMKISNKIVLIMCLLLICILISSTTALASGTGDVAGAIEGTWSDASGQIKTVVK